MASIAAFVGQSSSAASIALLRCQGVICCNPPDVYLFGAPTATRMSSLVTWMEGWPFPISSGAWYVFGSLVNAGIDDFSFSLLISSSSTSICLEPGCSERGVKLDVLH